MRSSHGEEEVKDFHRDRVAHGKSCRNSDLGSDMRNGSQNLDDLLAPRPLKQLDTVH